MNLFIQYIFIYLFKFYLIHIFILDNILVTLLHYIYMFILLICIYYIYILLYLFFSIYIIHYVYIYINESLCCILETNTVLEINYTPISNG